MRANDLFKFINERYEIYLKRGAGKPKPWTKDKILQQYRFCNTHRENDKVTLWISHNWREPNKDNPDLWFAMCVARFVNWPDTLDEIGFPLPWNPRNFYQSCHNRMADGDQVFTGAYIIPSAGPKIKYIADEVLTPVWEDRENIRPFKGDTLNNFFERLQMHNGFGSFMAAQVVADIKYVEPLASAEDWWTFASSGPGSRRGLNRVCGKDVDHSWTEEKWRLKLAELQKEIDPLVKNAGMPRLHAQDLQNCLCEFDKYERVRLGEGRPRSKYPDTKED
jgi:hypothetical protein